VTDVPFVDVTHTLLDSDWPLTLTDYDEIADPRDPVVFHYIRRYSPYDNVSLQAYPPMLVNVAEHDRRVPVWEALKWVARLRRAQTSRSLILLRIDSAAGHRGMTDRLAEVEDAALVYTFIAACLTTRGVSPPGDTRCAVSGESG